MSTAVRRVRCARPDRDRALSRTAPAGGGRRFPMQAGRSRFRFCMFFAAGRMHQIHVKYERRKDDLHALRAEFRKECRPVGRSGGKLHGKGPREKGARSGGGLFLHRQGKERLILRKAGRRAAVRRKSAAVRSGSVQPESVRNPFRQRTDSAFSYAAAEWVFIRSAASGIMRIFVRKLPHDE